MSDNIVYPRQRETQILAISDSIYKPNDNGDAYEKRISKHIEHLNILERDKVSLAAEMQNLIQRGEIVKHDGRRVQETFMYVHSMGSKRKQEAINLFEEFNRSNRSYFGFDIETFGVRDSQAPEGAYGISEISMNEYSPTGQRLSQGFNGVIRQNEDVIEELQKALNSIKDDKYTFNAMEGHMQRSVVDLMRYASLTDEGVTPFTTEGGIQHNSIIKEVFNARDEVDRGKVLRYLEGDKGYMAYMQSGLDNMKKIGYTPQEAYQEINKIIKSNSDKFFISFNGNHFDVPVLQAFGKKIGIPLEQMKHLDYRSAIETIYNDPNDLKKQVMPGYEGGSYGKSKQASYVEAFIENNNQSDAHNATVDTDNLAKVVTVTRSHMQTQLENAKTPIRDGFNHFPTQMTWNDTPLREGQMLYANSGIQAFGDTDESFRMVYDAEKNQWVAKSSDFDKNVINSKSFYQFAGHQQLDKGRQAFRFYNPDANEYTYIVRQGQHAYSELEDFIQSKFYNWENLSNDQQHEVRLAAKADQARRRYDRYFSADGGGSGLTIANGEVVERGAAGFSGLKRMLANLGAESMDDMDFNSQWNPESKSYVLNQGEKDQFFLMRGRLKDEHPYLSEAVKTIDGRFADEIEAAKKLSGKAQRDKLREINQKRDRALMNYQKELYKVTLPPTKEVELKGYENHRISYFDPEAKTKDKMRSINFETPESARSSIYGYARRGVDMEAPNKQRLMQERLNNLIENLHSQGKIDSGQHEDYMRILWNKNNTPYQASGEIAMSMRMRNSGNYDTHRMEDAIHENKEIKKLPKSINKGLIENALNDLDTAQFMIDMKATNGNEIVLSQEMKKAISVLDGKRFSGLQANNQKAIEELVLGIKKKNPASHIAMTMDTVNGKATGNVRVYAYDGKDSVSVYNQLQNNGRPAKAVEFTLPLANQNGIHEVGNRSLIAHSYAVLDGTEVKTISSTQYIAKGYLENMGRIMAAQRSGETDKANDIARVTLNDQLENMSGSGKNLELGENDSYRPARNQADNLKESHIKVSNAIVQDMYYNGFNGFKLKREDFYDPDSIFDGDRLKPDVSISDVKMGPSHKILMQMPDWAQERLKMPVYTDSLKAEHVGKGTISQQSMRQLMPFGEFYNHGRDNLIQHMNAYLLSDESKDKLNNIVGVSRNQLLTTEKQLEYNQEQIRLGNVSEGDILNGNKGIIRDNVGFNVKTAFMTQQQLRKGIQNLYDNEDGRKLLGEIGLLTEDGGLNHLKLPRLYEQQGIVADDLSEALKVQNTKRFAKGQQFEMAKGIGKNTYVKPGQVLGTRIHDNGHRETIRYEGTADAKVIQGWNKADDLIVQWDSDPFKLMVDGEKLTDSVASRKLITALTGQDDVGVILNPNVAGHMDYGMLMAGESRLFAEGINQLKPADKKKAIKLVEGAGVGLKWDNDLNGFLDDSRGKTIKTDAFQKVSDQLQKQFGKKANFVTSQDDIQFGILRAHQSKVTNNSKVVDGTGRRVIGYDEGYNAKTGEYEVRRAYGDVDGVQWGHREMGVLQSYNMPKTQEFLYNAMHLKTDSKGNVEINKRLTESFNVMESLKAMTEDHANLEALSTGDFETLPEQYRNQNTYRGTIFSSKESLIERMHQKYEGEDLQRKLSAIGDHGYYMELPNVDRGSGDGYKSQVTVNTDGTNKKALNKIFIPFTSVEGANGDVHLRNLQSKIANIYKRADQVNNAKTTDEARIAQGRLQKSVDEYVGQAFKELSTSDGMLLKDGFKTGMNNSASGLFKLMDYETSKKYGDGQFTVISEKTAKKMGVYDKLLKAAEEGKDVYAANVRYPTFHDGAMQFTKLRMSADVKEGEFHTTSIASMLQNADSDGDYSHIVVADDAKVQEEWKQAHDNSEKKFADKYAKHIEESNELERNPKPAASIHGTAPKGSKFPEEAKTYASGVIPSSTGNSVEETAAKIGKMTIGRASNLNLFLRQVADYHFADNPDMNFKIKEFGATLEQKLIDAKHGAKPVGLDMIDAIYAGKWNDAMQMDKEFFDGQFAKAHMEDMARELPQALEKTSNGLHSRQYKFGTSTGISYKGSTDSHGITSFLDMLHGQGIPDGDNKALKMIQKYLQEDHDIQIGQGSQEVPSPIQRQYQPNNMQERVDKGIRSVGDAKSFIRGTVANTGNKVRELWDNLKGVSGKKAALISGGLAVAGITGYNILNTEKPEMHYNNENEGEGTSQPQTRRQPTPALQIPQEDYSMQNASISISASGGAINQDQLSHAVHQGMSDVGMNAGPTRMTVNHTDNTAQLNRQWYRDKVRDNI